MTDIEAAAMFYGGVFQAAGQRVSPGRHYFDCGGVILACYDPTADGDAAGEGWKHHENQYIYFAVNDLAVAMERVRDGGGEILEGGVRDMPWGERLFYARDPCGNPISFVDRKTVFRGAL